MSLGYIRLLLTLIATASALGAVAHNHAYHPPHQERAVDGSFNGRDFHHRDAAGDHNVEFDHEAILGSVRTAEEFDHLSPTEAKKRLAALVKIMDRNSDQFVDRHELKAWILRSFV